MALAQVNIQLPEAFEPLFQPARYKAFYGGRGSAKSHSCATALPLLGAQRPLRILCCREIQNSIKDSVKKLLDDKIRAFGLGDFYRSTREGITSSFGTEFMFAGLRSNADSVRSMEGIDIAWVEEATTVSRSSLDLLIPTIRKPGSEIWFTWNPRFETDPVDSMFRGGEPPPNSIVRRVNWDSNPWFPEVLREEMEWDRRRDPDKYAFVWLGEYQRNSEARVFRNWRIGEMEVPHDAIPYYGADWGFSIDPTVLVRCYLLQPRLLYIDKEVYKIGCEIDFTPALFAGDDRRNPPRWENPHKWPGIEGVIKWPITADSARPETISYMQKRGFRIKPALKGAGSVEEGVTFMQSVDIVVHPECRHMIDELSLYSYKRDKLTNDILPTLEDKKNHCLAGDTVVQTVDGGKRIKDLVGKTGQLISYDEKTGRSCISEFRDVRKTREAAEIFRIELEDGRHIDLTGDHLVLTKRGWIEAQNLTQNDEIVDIFAG